MRGFGNCPVHCFIYGGRPSWKTVWTTLGLSSRPAHGHTHSFWKTPVFQPIIGSGFHSTGSVVLALKGGILSRVGALRFTLILISASLVPVP
jgi:hypothetical protein